MTAFASELARHYSQSSAQALRDHLQSHAPAILRLVRAAERASQAWQIENSEVRDELRAALRELDGEQAMTDEITKAIERLQEVSGRTTRYYAADLNDCRAEIVALMRSLSPSPSPIGGHSSSCGECGAIYGVGHYDGCALLALARAINGERT